MNKIIYNSQDDILLIDNVSYVGGFFKPDNVWGIIWNSPDDLWIEFLDGKTETSKGEYPHPEHVEQWGVHNVKAIEDAQIAAELEKKQEEDARKRQEQIEVLKVKVGIVFQEAGYSLDANELSLLLGQETEDCK